MSAGRLPRARRRPDERARLEHARGGANSAILPLVRAALAYLGLSGRSSREHWKLALVLVLPPLLLSVVIPPALGARGVAGWVVGVVCLVVLNVVWSLALTRSAAWRRVYDALSDQPTQPQDDQARKVVR